MRSKIRVLVVDDSAFYRMALKRLLTETGKVEVVGTASNGKEALEAAKTLSPDVITMDVEMPEMDGVAALGLLADGPWKVLMLSSYTTRGAEITIRALEKGAVDFVPKPRSSMELENIMPILLAKIEMAVVSGVPVHRRRKRLPALSGKCALLLVGASTGGPQALLRLFSRLKGPLPWPTGVAMHMLPGFTGPFARHLTEKTGHPTQEIKTSTRAEAGVIYVAPGGRDMVVKRLGTQIYFVPEGSKSDYSPSVDRLFATGARVVGKELVAIVMTGMGNDGLQGAREVAESGGAVYAQDKESSVVWGMPGAVAENNLARAVLSVDDMARLLEKLRRLA